jgi:Ser/Thr protein kinase RdoA (MazF antagonist)
MRWPADHPAVEDAALAPWAADVDRLCPDATVVRVLRHVRGRRVSTLVSTPRGPAVLKVFATSRARGGHRRLVALAESPAGPFVPRSIGNRKGHLLLIEFVPGVPMSEVDDGALREAAALAGQALRAMHDSEVVLDRVWTVEREFEQLRRTAGPGTSPLVERVIARTTLSPDAPMVPSHRDFHPAQVVVGDDGVRFVDLDDAAMAPRGLDVGNFVAHLEAEAEVGRRSRPAVSAAIAAFLAGYRIQPQAFDAWRRLTLARLVALAETRHGSPSQALRLAAALEETRREGLAWPA